MKTLLIPILLFSLNSFAKPINTGWFSSDAIKGYDSVAYFKLRKAIKGSKKFQFNWNGANWKFSSKENLAAFKTNPERYAPQYGGYCAYAMADGKKVSIDPKAFDIRNDKLYLNYSKGVQKKWRSGIKDFIKSADAEWGKTK